ncbi:MULTISPECIES: GNAT family N-acetyltransferase [Metabacillus]|uniref:GNAT family N-acetyltransferase n=1 Tax=Metabacillus endolithicus TaxID=1535204 RepID=A0ABW5BVA9_9BACI|nr:MULTISPECIES: GNAT family N-acetyltransferase [Metabacillus]UGB29874.1 GNAT family N-acetyltransferase [Metabacillus sp. B2-18]UPG64878.1 GNAT family N-acetyltransferase [Metabacillus endolithicus]
MEITIRFSEEQDFEKLIELDHRVWDAATTPADIVWNSVNEFRERNPEGSQIVAIVNGDVAGYLGYHASTPLKTNQHVMEIDIAVDKMYQGMGIGRKLLDKAIELAKERGNTKLSLRVLSTNKGALIFYKKCGFIEQGKLIKEFYIDGNYVDDVLMYRLIE